MNFYEIIETYNPLNLINVIKLIVKHYNQDLKNITVILIVDSI